MSDTVENWDDEIELQPLDASVLNGKQLIEELERRGLRVTRFADDDIKTLQKALHDEFIQEKESREIRRKEYLLKKQQEEDELRHRMFIEQQHAEEADAIAVDDTMKMYIELIQSNSSPSEITLTAEPAAIRAFIKAITQKPDLTSLELLDITGCNIGDDVAAEIGTCLSVNKSIKSLKLGYNQITNSGFLRIANSLSVNTTLESLSIECNPICMNPDDTESSTGIISLCNNLRVNTSLKFLNLFQCHLTEPAGKELSDLLEENYTLTDIVLHDVGLLPTDVFEIMKKLHYNRQGIASQEVAAKIERALERYQGVIASVELEQREEIGRNALHTLRIEEMQKKLLLLHMLERTRRQVETSIRVKLGWESYLSKLPKEEKK